MTLELDLPVIAAQTSLNRCGERRTDRAWIEARFHAQKSRFLPLLDSRIPIIAAEDRRSAVLFWLKPGDEALAGLSPHDLLFLGEDAAGSAFFAFSYSPHDLARNPSLTSRFHPAVDLRSLALQGVLSHDELLIAGQARSLIAWHGVNRCCGRCGAATLMTDAGWRRTCGACGQDHYPRMDPAVIMLITHDGKCLLGHEHRFPENMYSTLAGFVEPGDDIENAVRREVREEAGIEVAEVRYVMSQPWPFPHSLMIACWGMAASNAITIDTSELADIRWFTRDELADMAANRHRHGFFIPPSISLAHTLIHGFLAGTLG